MVICGNVSLTTPLMQFLLNENIPVVFLSMYGRYQGTLVPQISKNSLLRVAQHKTANDESLALALAQKFVVGKLTNMRTMLRRRNKLECGSLCYRKVQKQSLLHSRKAVDSPNSIAGGIKTSVERLTKMIEAAKNTKRLDELLGVEGAGTADYFSVFGRLLKSEMGFDFERRTRRPPADPTNSLLSFAYSLLTSDLTSAIQIVGLDPYIGFYHQLKYGRPCLSLDLMEEFRPIIADSVVIGLINHSIIKPEDFTETNGGYFLNDQARKKFYAAYEQRKDELVTHPVFKYKLSYRRAFELQARILAKFLTGEIDEYYPLTIR